MKPYLSFFLSIFSFVFFLFNFISREELYLYGVRVISTWQSTTSLSLFFNLVTFLADPTLVTILLLSVLIIPQNKSRSINLFILGLLNLYLIGVLKAIYADPRPFWSSSIEQLSFTCPRQYGNPSGHSWFITVITLIALSQYTSISQLANINKIISVTVAGGVLVLVPLSRMYLGAHSLNQVMEGVTFGVIMVVFYLHGGLKPQITTFLQTEKSTQKAIILGLLHLPYLYAFFKNEQEVNPNLAEWQANILLKCNLQIDTNSLNFMMIVANGVLSSLIGGLAWGYDDNYDNSKGKAYMQGKLNLQGIKQRTVYYGLQLALIASGVLGGAILAYFLKDLGEVVIFAVSCGGAFGGGYLYSAKTKKCLDLLGVVN